MKVYFSLLVILVLSGLTKAQWYQIGINPIGTFTIVKFASENIGWGARNDPSIIFKTTNGGETWFTQHITDGPIISIFFLDGNNGWFTDMDSNGGRLIFTSDGGQNWTTSFSQNHIFFHSLYFFDTQNGLAVGTIGAPATGGIFKTTNGGVNWNLVHIGDIGSSLSFLNDSIGWCGARDSIYKTTDAGDTWSALSININSFILKIKFLNESVGWLCTFGGNDLYYTSDGGNTWNLKLSSINDFWFTDLNNGWYNTSSKIYHTTNNGNSWEEQYSDTGNNLSSLYFMNSDLGWAVKSNGIVLHTNNGGTPVELVSFNASVEDEDIILHWITASETNNSGFEIERSEKQEARGEIWDKIGFVDGRGTTTEQQIYSFIDENVSSGKYQYRLKQIDFDGSFEYSNIVEAEVNIPIEFSLSQNYPNPFNPTTKIQFHIPLLGGDERGGLVTLKVYDVLGNEVTTLVNEEKQPGVYEVEFDGNNLSSGIYFYKFLTGNFNSSKKMIIIK